MHNHLRDVLVDKGHAVVHVPPTATVMEAVNVMNERGIGSVLVTEGERLLGIFTERDVLRRVLAEARDPLTTPVQEVMTRRLVVVHPDHTVEATMALMTEKRCRHLPVIDKDKLAGLISIGDLTRWVTRAQRIEIVELVDFITGRYPG